LGESHSPLGIFIVHPLEMWGRVRGYKNKTTKFPRSKKRKGTRKKIPVWTTDAIAHPYYTV